MNTKLIKEIIDSYGGTAAAAKHFGYKDSLADAEQYSIMVCEGTWPDYKNINPDCGSDK